MILTDDQILQLLEKPANPHIKAWAKEHARMDIYYNGGDVASELEQIKNYENLEQKRLRENIARSTKDLMSYLLNPLNKIFSASGFKQNIRIENQKSQDEFLDHIMKLPEGISLRNWMKVYWLEAYVIDPNGVIFIEVKDEKAYPTYKSIATIHDYMMKWDSFEYIIFREKEVEVEIGGQKTKVQVYRVYDDEKDALYFIKDNLLYKYGNIQGVQSGYDQDHYFSNVFGKVPAFLPSDIIDKKTGGKKSFINIVDETLKEYMRDSSVHSIYKFLHGFPIFWSYASKCVRCSGTGRIKNVNYVEGGQGDTGKTHLTCPSCSGDGLQRTKDVSDGVRLPIPNSEDPKLAPDIAGYVTPDLETWTKQVEEMEELKKDMFYAIWGTYLVDSHGVEKTATEAFINAQPIMDKLHPIADLAETIESSIAKLMATVMYGKESQVDIKYGRRWLIETPDILWNRYIQAKKDHAPISSLDYLYEQFLLAEYHNDNVMLNRKLKEFSIEPFVHYSLQDMRGTASPKQMQEKLLFNEWAVSLQPQDYEKDLSVLKSEFKTYVTENSDITEQVNTNLNLN